jgi:hypothetical protein
MSTGYVRSWPKPEICCDGASRRPSEVKRTCHNRPGFIGLVYQIGIGPILDGVPIRKTG